LFEEPLELCRSADLPILEIATLNNLAWYQLEDGLVDKARGTVSTIEQIIESSGRAANLSVVDTIARVLRASGEPDRAERLLNSAITGPDAASITEPATIPGTLVTRAAFARDRGALDLAQRDLERALDIAENAGFIEISVEALRELSSLAAERGDFRAAYGHLLACHTEWEQLKQVEAEVKAATLQVLHGTERALERVRAYEELARTDPLTGLWNRRFLENELPPILERAARRQQAVVLAIADIDYFKRVNDELSHDVGDTVLQTFARLIRTVVGDAGTVVRLGGEEFLLVLDRCNSLQAQRIIRQVCTTVREHDWVGAGIWPLTISIGVVSSRIDRSIPELLALADQNLYRAKRAGRDQVVGAET
jgi:diguanylate cyclase (GGDEF)-like protein